MWHGNDRMFATQPLSSRTIAIARNMIATAVTRSSKAFLLFRRIVMVHDPAIYAALRGRDTDRALCSPPYFLMYLFNRKAHFAASCSSSPSSSPGRSS